MNGVTTCSCPGYKYKQKCKHISVYEGEKAFGTKAKPKYQTPQEAQKERREAAKYGKKIAPLVSKNPAYKTTKEKVEEDPELKEFLDTVS